MERKYQVLEQGQVLQEQVAGEPLTYKMAYQLFRLRYNTLIGQGWEHVHEAFHMGEDGYEVHTFYNPRTFESTSIAMTGDNRISSME